MSGDFTISRNSNPGADYNPNQQARVSMPGRGGSSARAEFDALMDLHKVRRPHLVCEAHCRNARPAGSATVKIQGSVHQLREAPFVSEEIEHLCEYVNDPLRKLEELQKGGRA